MRIAVEIDDILQVIAASERDVERAVTSGMKAATTGLKNALRQDVVSVGLGARLSRTWRGRTYPEAGTSMEAAAYVWSKAPLIIDAFDRGATIVARSRRFLAVPTKDAGVSHTTMKNKRLTPAIWETETGVKLRFLARGSHALLVTDGYYVRQPARWRRRKSFKPIRTRSTGSRKFLVIFILLPQVSLRKRLDIDSIAKAWAGRVPSLIAQHWTER